MVAQVMIAIPEVSLFYVEMGGFDTHALQIGFPDIRVGGRHAILLAQLSDAIAAFHADLAEHSLADRVLMMTVSDFGRRASQNGSDGTDHGTAAPVRSWGSGAWRNLWRAALACSLNWISAAIANHGRLPSRSTPTSSKVV
jgi:uncharacterized protein (DUF1501 family)